MTPIPTYTFFVVKFNLTVSYKLIEISGGYESAKQTLEKNLAIYSPAGAEIKAYYVHSGDIAAGFRTIVALGLSRKKDIMTAIAIEEHEHVVDDTAYTNVLEYHREIKMLSDDTFDDSWEMEY